MTRVGVLRAVTLESLAAGERVCVLCDEAKPFDGKHWRERRAGVPYGSYCRACRNKRNLERYHERVAEQVA